jgi:hypothetical protein
MDAATRPFDATTSLDEPVGISRRIPSTEEAPDRGELEREAPESRSDRVAEAPDAGEAPNHVWEHEFTHGRSQS